MIQACQCQANPTPSRGWKPFCSLPRVRFCAVTTSPLIQYAEPPGRNGCAEMTVHRQVAVRAKLVRTASTRFPRYGTAKSWQNASKCPQKPAGRRCAAWRPPCGRGPAMPRSADTSNLIVAFGSATVFTSTLTLGANQIRGRPLRKRFRWVGDSVPQASPATHSASSKVRRRQFAAAGREAA